MAKLERSYVIPLRKGFVKVPKYYRSKRAINQIKDFISKHMKSEDIKIGKELNEYVWKHGIKNPPGKVKVKAIKDGNTVTVELEGFEYKVEKIQTEKTEKPSSLKEKLASKLKVDEQEKQEPEKEAPSEKEPEKPAEAPAKKKAVKKTKEQ